MNQSLLSPIEVVEVGYRVPQDRLGKLGLTRLVEDARLVVRSVLDSMASAVKNLGIERDELVTWALEGRPRIRYSRKTRPHHLSDWARSSVIRRASRVYRERLTSSNEKRLTKVGTQRAGQIPLPSPRTVLRGRKQRAGEPLWTAFSLDRGHILLLGDSNPENVYVTWTQLNEAADVPGPDSWEVLDSYQSGQRLTI